MVNLILRLVKYELKRLFYMNKCKILILSLIIVLLFSSSAFGLTSSTYGSLLQNNNNANTLISYASNYDSFFDAEYVVYQGAQYDYYIVWGDLSLDGSTLRGSDVEYIMYYREGAVGSYDYKFRYSSDDSFSLNIADSVVSNVTGAGGDSVLYNQLYFYDYGLLILTLIGGFLFAKLLLRR